jgi:hypothetical protein
MRAVEVRIVQEKGNLGQEIKSAEAAECEGKTRITLQNSTRSKILNEHGGIQQSRRAPHPFRWCRLHQ